MRSLPLLCLLSTVTRAVLGIGTLKWEFESGNEFCYAVLSVSHKYTWEEARDECEKQGEGARLPIVRSDDVNNNLANYAREKLTHVKDPMRMRVPIYLQYDSKTNLDALLPAKRHEAKRKVGKDEQGRNVLVNWKWGDGQLLQAEEQNWKTSFPSDSESTDVFLTYEKGDAFGLWIDVGKKGQDDYAICQKPTCADKPRIDAATTPEDNTMQTMAIVIGVSLLVVFGCMACALMTKAERTRRKKKKQGLGSKRDSKKVEKATNLKDYFKAEKKDDRKGSKSKHHKSTDHHKLSTYESDYSTANTTGTSMGYTTGASGVTGTSAYSGTHCAPGMGGHTTGIVTEESKHHGGHAGTYAGQAHSPPRDHSPKHTLTGERQPGTGMAYGPPESMMGLQSGPC